MTQPLFEVKEVDRRFYAERLRGFLPPRMIDIHTHVWRERFRAPTGPDRVRAVTWPARVALDNSIEDLLTTYRLLFPEQRVSPLLFGNVMSRRDDVDGANAYVSESSRKHGLPALVFALPSWSGAELARQVVADGFIGAKVYLTLAPARLPEPEIQIYDFLPKRQLAALDRLGGIVMLHLPRPGRLRDPLNLRQVLEIEERYANLKVILAHVGRAYCPEDVGNAWDVLSATRRTCFDISANTNSDVFRQLLDAVGPQRVLFGSDLPITRMRMRRICEQGNYVNIVPRGLYGDVSGDAHMREADGPDAERLSFFLYEELDAFRRAAEAVGLTRNDVEDMFCRNAERLIREASAGRSGTGEETV